MLKLINFFRRSFGLCVHNWQHHQTCEILMRSDNAFQGYAVFHRCVKCQQMKVKRTRL